MSRLLAAQRALTVPGWVKEELSRKAQAIPSLDLRFADSKSLVDASTGANLVTFTRASSGTFVGSDGVLRTATTNFLLRSEEFDNASWTKTNATITPDAIASPTRGITADKLVENAGGSAKTISQTVSFSTGLNYTFSIYLKAAERTEARISMGAAAFSSTPIFTVNLLTGAAVASSGAISTSVVAVGNGWYRVSITALSTATASASLAINPTVNNVAAYTGDGTSGIYLWGAQLEQSSTEGEYIPTTSTINSAPRFDHNPTTGESLGLLVEEQRTNSIRNNTMVGAVAGTPGTTPTNWTITSSATGLTREVVGTGTESGITYIDIRYSGTSTSAGSLQISADTTTGVPALTGQTWAGSSYVRLVSGSLPGAAAWVWLERDSGGTIVVSGPGGSVSLTEDALSSQRRTTTRTLSGGATVANLSLRIDVTVPNATAVNVTLRIGLPQLEQGAFATSVIPTTGATVTRSADVVSITGTNFSSWYNQSEGTVFADVTSAPVNTIAQLTFDISEGVGNERMFQRRNASGIVATAVLDNGVTQGDVGSVVIGASARFRSAFAYKLNDLEVMVNGGGSTTDTSATIPTVDRLYIGQNFASGQGCNGTIRRLTYWPQRLSNSTLQTLTQ